MPARTSTRSTRTSAARSSVASSAPEVVDTPDNALRTKICAVFCDAQRTTATHRKLVVNLRKIQESCCYEPENPNPSQFDDFDEDAFNREFIRCVTKIMPIKKSESVGERSIRFVGLFLRHASEKDNELMGDVEDEASVMPETPSTRLISQLLEAILPLMTAKDKVVRYRSTQLVSHIINSLDAIDDDLFQKLRHGLLKRIRDKEAMVRSQAVLGLGRLAGNHVEGCTNSDDSEDGDTGLLEKLLEVLQNDPNADVRRSLLVNLPILPETLSLLLERARDQDAATRRAVYSRLLPALGDFRHLSVKMREKLLRWGVRDRDENVRKAAGRLFRERWIEDCAGVQPRKDGAPAEPSPPSFEGLQELLERIDVVNTGVENGVALEAMKGFWEGRPDYRETVEFNDSFWETLSAESVFMARSYNEFCRNEGDGKYLALLEEKLPEVTKLAFFLERYLHVLVEAVKRVAEGDEDEDEEEEDTVEQEFIVEQLLQIVLTLDYSDEVGRRKMFTLLRQAISIPELPDEVTKLAVEALQGICSPDAAGEREFISIVLESVADVHDTIVDEPPADEPEDSFHSARSEVSSRPSTPTNKSSRRGHTPEMTEEEAHDKAVKEIVVNMKCLHIVQCMLTHVSINLQDNTDLVSMLNNLVVPAVRSHEAPVRERGLVCLGLCALLDRSVAEENLTLFMHFFSKGHTALQITALHILTDMLNVHGADLLSSTPSLLKVYIKAVKGGAKSPEVQAAATVAVSKLLLGRVVSDEEACQDLLKSLVVAYFDPSSASNQTVRQALNYFLPVFCFSRAENQDLMRTIALDAIHALFNVREGLEDDDVDVEEDMVSMTTIGACLVDWTDPRKCYSPTDLLDTEKKVVNGDVHLEFAMDILEKLQGNIAKEEKKLLASLLGKLHVSPGSTEEKLREAYTEVSAAVEDGLLGDATSRNALYKIHVSLGKIVNALDDQQQQPAYRRSSRSTSVTLDRQTPPEEEKSVVSEPRIKEEEEDSDNTIVPKEERESLVDELLSDGDDVEMTDV